MIAARGRSAWSVLLGAVLPAALSTLLACTGERQEERATADAPGGATEDAPDGARGESSGTRAPATSTPENAATSYEALAAHGAMAFVAGDSARALDDFERARELRPEDPEAALNVAIAAHFAGRYDLALEVTRVASSAPATRAAALYVAGCAHLRREEWSSAEEALSQARALDAEVPAVALQLGWARFQYGDYEGAAAAFSEVVALEPLHPAAHYMLSQAYARLGRAGEARAASARHQAAQQAHPRSERTATREAFEACVLTDPRLPMQPSPAPDGVPVRFVAVSGDVLDDPDAYDAPLCYIDVDGDDDMDLFVRHGNRARVLRNDAGVLVASGPSVALGDGRFVRAIAGRVKRGTSHQVFVLGETTSRLFDFPQDGAPLDLSAASGLAGVGGHDALLANLDHTGALDVVVATGSGLRFLRNAGDATFTDETDQTGLPRVLAGARSVATGDLDGDDLLDLVVGRRDAPVAIYRNAREGRLTPLELPAPLPSGTLVRTEDIDGDFRLDVLVASGSLIRARFGDGRTETVSQDVSGLRAMELLDYDNDGWLDLLTLGDRLRLFRNRGERGFLEVTAAVGLERVPVARAVAPIDVDTDGDVDLVLAKAGGGLEVLENEGGNANASVRLAIERTSDGDSVYGARVEIFAGGFRTSRTVVQLPLDVGLGTHTSVGLVNVVWPDQIQQIEEIAVGAGDTLAVVHIAERYTQAGSCPYLYAWDGEGFRFVTDILGVSPLGLPLAPGLLTPADTDELAWVGADSQVVPREGAYELRVTEELREVLFLDETKLVVVDHPERTEVHSTDKLRVPPFPPSEIVTVERPAPLRGAVATNGADATRALDANDGVLASPPVILGDHLRGRAAPHGYVLDFGPLDAGEQWVLALTGWLRYGGASGNMSAARDPGLPSPFPTLELESASGEWRTLDVVVGLPAGKTKTILVDLAGLVPEGSRRLRLTLASEVHWDRAALFRRARIDARVTMLAPDASVLRRHGYGEIEPHAWNEPVMNSYHRLAMAPPWRWTPAGRYTRYGEVEDLVADADDRLVVLGGGDEVALSFAASRLPELPEGYARDFFFLSVGWDKDADYNCIHGLTVLPLPYHGMDDQAYGSLDRPSSLPSEWITRYTTRAVDAEVPGTRHETVLDAMRARAASATAWRSPLPSERHDAR